MTYLPDWVFLRRIELTQVGGTWREALTGRARSARSVLTRSAVGAPEGRCPTGRRCTRHDRLRGDAAGDQRNSAAHHCNVLARSAPTCVQVRADRARPAVPRRETSAEEAFAVKVAASAELYPHDIARSRAAESSAMALPRVRGG